MNSIPNRWIKWPAIALFLYIIIRLIDYGKIMFYHPLSNLKHDIYSYLPLLYFLKECGFHQWCPYWYNGFETFVATPPGWFFFTYPLYILTNLRVSFYLSFILVYILIMLAIWYGGKKLNMSKFQRLAFFGLFLGNNVMINTLRLGKAHEVFAWLFFIIGFFMIYYFKDRPVNNKLYWLIIPYSLALLSYHAIAMLFSPLLLGWMIVHRKNFFQGTLVVISSFILTSFWWVYLLTHFSQKSIISNEIGVEAWWMFKDFAHFTSIGVFIIPLITFAAFWLYYSTNKEKKNVLFFLPSLILVLMFFLGLLPFFPIIDHIYTNMYFTFMIFLTTVFLFSTNYAKVSSSIKSIIPVLFWIGTIATIGISLLNTPFFDAPTLEQQDLVNVAQHVNGTFLVTGDLSSINSHRNALYSYGVVELGLTSASGHYPIEKEASYLKDILSIYPAVDEGRCSEFLSTSKEYKITDYISYGEGCTKLADCSLSLITTSHKACLYRI
jgi:hypothetical protein